MTNRRLVRGFTMVEILLVIVLTSILSSVIIPVLLGAVECMSYDQTRNNLVETSRLTMDRLALEIWRNSDSQSIISATNGKYEFDSSATEMSECAGGGTVTQRRVTFTYDDAGNSLQLSLRPSCDGVAQATSTSTLTGFVDNFVLKYLDENCVITNNLTDIRTVRVKVTFNDSRLNGTRLYAPYTLISEFRLRNKVSEKDYLP